MIVIPVQASRRYEVRIGSGLLSAVPEQLASCSFSTADQVCVVSDDRVFPLYGETLTASLREAGFRTYFFVFPHGEEQKSLTTYEHLTEYLCGQGFTRTDLLIALGGGVVGDLAGFAAATYQRGIPVVQIPTTLLAAVDSSVGGKTAVNLSSGKNQVGCFYQPSLVLYDPLTFQTLPEREYRNGCAEIIKYAMLDDEPFFRSLEETPISSRLEEVVATCVRKKRFYVEQDEKDKGVRKLLNFGHTLGHAAEKRSGFTLPHGEAVAIGMAVLTRAAVARGYCAAETADRLEALLRQYGLPVETAYSAAELAKAAQNDKKSEADLVSLIVPDGIGACRAEQIPKRDLADWFRAGGCS